MAVKRSALVLAFFITFSLFLSILLIGAMLDDQREVQLDDRFDQVYRDLQDLQNIQLVQSVYGNESACIAYKSKLLDFNKRIWDLGLKLEQYRQASEEVVPSEYYLSQKRIFNENEFTYFMLLKQIKKLCASEQSVILFFYRNGRVCPKCDDQSFVLSDIRRQFGENVAIFSYDLDLNLTSLGLLAQVYAVNEEPCVIINDKTHCGMQDRQYILDRLCESSNGTTCA